MPQNRASRWLRRDLLPLEPATGVPCLCFRSVFFPAIATHLCRHFPKHDRRRVAFQDNGRVPVSRRSMTTYSAFHRILREKLSFHSTELGSYIVMTTNVFIEVHDDAKWLVRFDATVPLHARQRIIIFVRRRYQPTLCFPEEDAISRETTNGAWNYFVSSDRRGLPAVECRLHRSSRRSGPR